MSQPHQELIARSHHCILQRVKRNLAVKAGAQLGAPSGINDRLRHMVPVASHSSSGLSTVNHY